jgi:hypothetical protein
VENPFLGGDADATCCMPMAIDEQYLTYQGEVSVNVYTPSDQPGVNDGPIAYFYFKFADVSGPLNGLEFPGWCIDLSRGLGTKEFSMDVFSSYDDVDFDNAIDKPQMLPNVNWLINTYKLNTTVTVPTNHNDKCTNTEQDETFVIEWGSLQNAIWSLMDSGSTSAGIYRDHYADEDAEDFAKFDGTASSYQGANECLGEFLYLEALNKGNGFVPDCSDPDAEIAVVFVLDHDDIENKIVGQVVIGEVPLSAIPGICQPKECCEQRSVDHEAFVANTEIEATYTKGESTTAAWSVDFTAGSSGFSQDLGRLGSVDAWSMDLDRDSTIDGTYKVDTYSVYDNWYRFNAVDRKGNVTKVNYLINTYPVGTMVDSCGRVAVTVADLQAAIWYLMDFAADDPTESCIGTFLFAEASANGAGYEPSCAEGTTDKIALLMIVDDGTDYKRKFGVSGKHDDLNQLVETVQEQVLIASVPVSAVSGACYMKDCECCEIVPPTPAPTPAPVPGPTPAPVVFTLPPIQSPTGPTDPRDDPTNPSPVDEINTPAPVPVRPPGPQCEDQIDILGSNFGPDCGNKGVYLLASRPPKFEEGSGNEPPPLRIDLLDTFFGITLGDGNSVSFRTQNPFEGGAVDMYVQLETPSRNTICEQQPAVDECEALKGGTVMESVCIGGGDDNYAIVDVFFVESGGDLFDVTYTGEVPQCCEPDATNTGAVVSYTFVIRCSCPTETA